MTVPENLDEVHHGTFGSFAFPAYAQFRSRFLRCRTTHPHRDRHHRGDDGARDHGGSYLPFDGTPGRWLAHEDSCERVAYYRNGILSMPQAFIQRAFHWPDRENRGCWWFVKFG